MYNYNYICEVRYSSNKNVCRCIICRITYRSCTPGVGGTPSDSASPSGTGSSCRRGAVFEQIIQHIANPQDVSVARICSPGKL